jgi:hypothetical protein
MYLLYIGIYVNAEKSRKKKLQTNKHEEAESNNIIIVVYSLKDLKVFLCFLISF